MVTCMHKPTWKRIRINRIEGNMRRYKRFLKHNQASLLKTKPEFQNSLYKIKLDKKSLQTFNTVTCVKCRIIRLLELRICIKNNKALLPLTCDICNFIYFQHYSWCWKSNFLWLLHTPPSIRIESQSIFRILGCGNASPIVRWRVISWSTP